MRKLKTGFGLVFLVLALSLSTLLAACGGTEETTTSVQPSTTEASGSSTTVGQDTTTTTAAPGPAETLKIGAVLQLTDWYSTLDLEEQTDLNLVAKLINEEYPLTVQGKRYDIEIVAQDGKSNLDGNTAAATKLALDDKVKFVVGPSAFFNAATSPIFEQNKVLHVAGYNTFQPGELGPETPYGFLGYLDPVAANNVLLKAIKQEYPDVKNVCLILADEAAATYLVPHLKQVATDLGLNVVGEPVLFSLATDDFNPIAAKVNGIEADAYWIATGSPGAYSGITKGLRVLSNQKPIAFPGFAPSVVDLIGPENSNNILVAMSYQYGGKYNSPIIEKVLELGDTKRMWFGLSPNALWVLVEVIRAADSLDPEVVKAKWETMTNVSTLYGPGVFGGTKLYGLPNRSVSFPVPVAKLMDGKIIDLPWVTPEPTP